MTTIRRLTRAILAIVLLSAGLHAQEVSPRTASPYLDERTGLGLDDAMARALEREPGLRAARSDIDVARGQRQQAGLRANPTVSVERRQEPGGTDTLTAVGVIWPLELFRRQGRMQAADQELAVAQISVADRERLLAADVRLQYGMAAAAARDVSVADELVMTLERQVELARARVSEGALPRLDRDLLEVEVRRLRAERVAAAGRAEVAILLLKQWLGMGPDEPLRLRESLDALVAREGPAAPASAAASGDPRADVREAEARVRLADARADEARREGRVDVSLFGSYMRMDAGFPQSGIGPSGAVERVRGQFNYASVGAMVALPLFNRNQGEVARAQAERTGAEARLDAAALAARSEIAAARARDTRAREAVALLEGDTRVLARQNLDVVRQTFDLGRATVFDVLTEQRRYLEFEQAYSAALREAWEARATLARAVGDTK
jgi:cobalt-zinc-cadmium efflux system outer membrane protein